MKDGSGNSQKEKKNVTDWYVNDSESSWLSLSWKCDWEWSLRRNKDKTQLLERQ